jgi:hypothetical protein
MVIVGPHWKCPHCEERHIPTNEHLQPLLGAAKAKGPSAMPRPLPPQAIMTTQGYWPALHRLAEAGDAQGLAKDERIQAILKQLLDLPPTVRRQLLADALRLSMELPEVHGAAAAAIHQAEQPSDQRFRGAESASAG